MGNFGNRDVGVIGGDRGEHVIEGGCMRSLVGVVSEDDAGRTSRVCTYEIDREAVIDKGIAEEVYVIIARRSVNGRKLFLGRLEYEDDFGDGGNDCGEAGMHGGKDRGNRGG